MNAGSAARARCAKRATRRVRRQLVERQRAVGHGHGQRRNRVDVLAGETQHDPAGDQEPQARASAQRLGQLGCGVDEVLQVVEQQQQAAVAEERDQALAERPVAGLVQS
jgi:hypothetical protein